MVGLSLIWMVLGYLSGSVLYAKVFEKWLGKDGALARSRDGNPGTANAFMYGGFLCGTLTLLGDLLKGIIPVYLYVHASAYYGAEPSALPLVMAAPVLGHAFPVLFRFRGGKGIAVTFGCLIGLLPCWEPLVVLAAFFLLFTLIIRIIPHFCRTLATYILSAMTLCLITDQRALILGFLLIAVIVGIRLSMSHEEKQKLEVKLLWMR